MVVGQLLVLKFQRSDVFKPLGRIGESDVDILRDIPMLGDH